MAALRIKRTLGRALAYAVDGAMCGTMNVLQWRHRGNMCSLEELQAYLLECSTLSREEFYRAPAVTRKLDRVGRTGAERLSRKRQIPCPFPSWQPGTVWTDDPHPACLDERERFRIPARRPPA
jgi:hypothetical protein